MRPPGFVCIGLFVAVAAHAHHSPSAFDMAAEIEVVGVVIAYEWANPHVYITIESTGVDGNGETWEIETNGISMMRRRGWTADTFAAGERITVSGNPGRDADGRIILLRTIERDDGTILEYLSGQFTEAPDATSPAESLNGIWVADGSGTAWQVFTRPAAMPLTEAGRQALAGFIESRDSNGIDCIPYSLPMMMLLPDIKSFETGDQAIVIRSELDATVRTIHLNADPEAEAPLTDLGHSIGRWEDQTLIVETSRFAPHSQGLGTGLASSAGKRVVERFSIAPDRTSFVYSVTVEDPMFLEAPVGGEMIYRYRPDLEFVPAACNLDSARRFLDY